MKRVLQVALALALALAGLALFSLWPPGPLAMPAQGAILDGVTVVRPGEGRESARRVVVEGGRIARIDASSGAGSPYAGHFVLPGLADLHVHFPPSSLPGQGELFSFLYLFHGVTSVRDAGDVDGTATDPVRQALSSGAFPGPRVIACGPFVDGPDPIWGNSRVVKTRDDAERVVAEIADRGYQCVKVYDRLSGEALEHVRAAARARGLPLVGHVPRQVGYAGARLDDVQHMTLLAVPPAGTSLEFPAVMAGWTHLDDAQLAAAVEATVRLGIANTPTLVATERRTRYADFAALRDAPDALLLPRLYRDVLWSPLEGLPAVRSQTPAQLELLESALPAMLRTVAALHAAGAPLRTGSDVLNPFVVPGASLYRELHLFVRAGLTPEQALAVATRDSAGALGVPGLGRLEPGAPADLLVFRQDPTRDLAALATLEAVIADGRLYARAALDAQLARYREHFEGALYDWITVALARRALARVEQAGAQAAAED
jgi:imidazolonepropionase-like amidohydrolase